MILKADTVITVALHNLKDATKHNQPRDWSILFFSGITIRSRLKSEIQEKESITPWAISTVNAFTGTWTATIRSWRSRTTRSTRSTRATSVAARTLNIKCFAVYQSNIAKIEKVRVPPSFAFAPIEFTPELTGNWLQMHEIAKTTSGTFTIHK